MANLQKNAATMLKEYRNATALSLQYVIENHNLVDVDVQIMSSFVIVPQKGTLAPNCACAVVNLGSIMIKSSPITAESRSLRNFSLEELKESFKKNLQDQERDSPNSILFLPVP